MTLGKSNSRTEPMKSLVHPFDELVRKAKVLHSGCESEFRNFVQNEDKNRQKWLQAEQNNETLEDRVKRLESAAATLETQLKHARLQAEYELQRRKAAEQEKYDANNQIGVIRELLSDRSKSIIHDADRERLTAFANSPRLNTEQDLSNTRLNTIMERSQHSFLDDVSFDKTEEDILSDSRLRCGKKWKRPSAPPSELMGERHTPPKRHCDENASIVTATVTIDAGGHPTASLETSIPKLNKSFSEPSLDKHGRHDDDDGAFGFHRNNNYNSSNNNINYNAKPRKSILKSTGDTPTPQTPMMRKANSAGRGLNRIHLFVSKTVIKPEVCVPCGKRIRFSKMAMKCKDCRAVCHPECKDRLPLPCIPSCPSTPGGNKLMEGLICDYAPSERPMIPRLVVNCVNEIETRGLQEVGLYRVPGSDKDQKELKVQFLKGRSPNLSNIMDIHVVCGCLKDFLRGLKEPLVTFTLWEAFIGTNDLRRGVSEALVGLIHQLPQANKDTLAFLLQHLHSVATSPACKMPASNLAKVFGPTVVGYSCPDPEPMQIMGETQKQNKVMEHILEIHPDFWGDLLAFDDISLFPAGTPYTPDSAAPRSMLGPLRTPDMPDSYSMEASRVHNTPRFAVKTREPTKPSRFFSSPLVH